MKKQFVPNPWIKNRHLQTIFGSLNMRVYGPNPMVECAKEMIIDGGNGVRLLGYHSLQPRERSRGLVTLIHGWEGSSDSTYVLSTGRYLYVRGYDIFRLNLRDHGNSHHLNEGLFHGALIEEAFQAIYNISRLSENIPYYVIGFSLGGNFALRVGVKHSSSSIPNLRNIISISPALDPYKTTLAIDASLAIYKYYFLKKWKNSLRIKQKLFPDRYDFHDILKMQTCMALTEAIMPYYPDFKSYKEYFSLYTLRNEFFSDLAIPVTIIASEDDPIVSIYDVHKLRENTFLSLSVQAHGGHCGFIDLLPIRCWYEEEIARIFNGSDEI
jgi:uncharacterized protein